MPVDIDNLPAPPTSGVDIDSLPAPTQASAAPSAIDELPAPPKPPEEHETPAYLGDRDFQAIAEKHGVDPKDLKAIAPYYGVQEQPTGGLAGAAGQAAKYTAGFAGRVAFGIPQFIYKKLQDQPMREALDELNEIGHKQKGYIEAGTELAAMPFAGAGGATEEAASLATRAGRVVKSSAIGSGIGAANAPEGQEARGAKFGALFGGGVGLAGETLGAALARRGANQAEEAAASRMGSAELDKGADEIAAKTQDSEDILRNAVLNEKEINPDQARTIVQEQLDPEVAKEAMDSGNEVGHMLRKAVGAEDQSMPQQEAVMQQLAQTEVDNRTIQFAKSIEGKTPGDLDSARTIIDQYAERQGGPEALEQKWQDFIRSEQVDRYINDSGARTVSRDKWWDKLLNFFSGNQFVNRDIDDRFGTDTEGILSRMTAQNNRSTFAQKAFSTELDSIDRDAGKLGVEADLHNPEEAGKIRQALEAGSPEGLSPQEQQVAGRIHDYLNKFLDFVNGMSESSEKDITPLSIPKRVNYFPHVMRDTPEIVNVVDEKMDATLKQLSEQLGRPITDIKQLNRGEFQSAMQSIPELQDIADAMRVLGRSEAPTRPQDFSARFTDQFRNRSGLVATETAARAAEERTDSVPQWMLETDTMRALDKYTRNTLRHLYIRRPMDQLQKAAENIRNAGGEYEANYLNRLSQDQLGFRKNTAGEAQLQTSTAFMNTMDKLADKNPTMAPVIKAVKAVPSIMQNMVRGMFANVLGYRTRPLLMHGTQTLTKLMPELGMTPYGAYAAMRGVVGAALDFRGMYAEAERLGNVVAEGHMQPSRALANGIQRSLVYKLPAGAINGINQVGMLPFEKMIQVNRSIAVSTAKVMAHDLARGSAAADGALSRFPRNIQAAVRGTEDEAEKADVLGRYLNSVTQYNYDRMNMSEFGRTMGPLFSAFSTWPTNTLGDMVYEFRNRGFMGGVARNAEKYVAPLGMLMVTDYALRQALGNHGQATDRMKAIMGQGGLASTAPLGSIGAFLKGEAITPIVINAVTESVIHPLLEAQKHPDRAQQTFMKGFSNTLNSFMPGAGLIHFLTDDLVTEISGHRPEGSTQVERTVEGARQLKKIINK